MGNCCRSQFLKGLFLICLLVISACNAGQEDQLSEKEADDYLRRMVEESLTDQKVLEKIATNKSDSTAALLLAKKETLALPEKKVITSATLPVKKDTLVVKKKSIKADTSRVKVASVQDSLPKLRKQVSLKALPPKPQPIVKDSLKKDTGILAKKPSKKKKNTDITPKDTVKPAPKVIEPMGQKPAQKPIPVPQMPIIKPDTSGN